VLIAVTVVTARRPADNREALLRGLPPSTYPLPIRLAQLRFTAREQLMRQAVVGLIIGGIVGLVGSMVVLATHLTTLAGFAAATLYAVWFAIGWQVFAGIHLLGRYLGARRRVVLDSAQ
jgi:hypothetical protein